MFIRTQARRDLFQLRCLIFMFSGAGGVGRRHIKNTLIARNPSRYTYPRPRKYSIFIFLKTSANFSYVLPAFRYVEAAESRRTDRRPLFFYR